MSKPKAVPMPIIEVRPQANGYVTVKSSERNTDIDVLVGEFWRCCLDTEMAMAEPDETKQLIMGRAKVRLKTILDKGERYCILLQGALARGNLQALTYSSEPKQVKTFSKVCEDFDAWWKENPRKHNAHLLAEYL